MIDPPTFHEAQQTTPRPETCHTSTQTDSVLTPPTFHEAQQTTPRPDNCHTYTQTDIHAIIRYPSFAAPKTAPQATTSPQQSTPPQSTAAPPTTATITSAANKQPNPDQWLYAELIPTPTVDNPPSPALPSDFTAPIGGTPHRARSKTPPRSTTPQRARFTQGRHSDPRHGSPVPQPRSTAFIPAQQSMHPPPTTFGQPKRPPPPLPQQQPASTSHNWYPTTPPPVQAPYPCTAPPATYNPTTHPWPAPYQPQQFPQQSHSTTALPAAHFPRRSYTATTALSNTAPWRPLNQSGSSTTPTADLCRRPSSPISLRMTPGTTIETEMREPAS